MPLYENALARVDIDALPGFHGLYLEGAETLDLHRSAIFELGAYDGKNRIHKDRSVGC